MWELRSDSAVDDPVPSEEVLEHLLGWFREAGSFSETAKETMNDKILHSIRRGARFRSRQNSS